MSLTAVSLHRLGQPAGTEKHLVAPRLLAGLPVVGIGLAHVFEPSAPMQPIIEAAGFPAASVLSPLAVALELVAGTLLLLGLWTRLGAALVLPTMAVAVYAHLAIDVWPNDATSEPPILLPLAVMVCAAYVLWRGAGRWSIDRLVATSRA